MLVRVLLAFGGARIARRRTRATQINREWPTARHRSDRRRARIGAVAIEANALHHRRDVRFAETRIAAPLARHEALDAGRQTGAVFGGGGGQQPFEIDRHGLPRLESGRRSRHAHESAAPRALTLAERECNEA